MGDAFVVFRDQIQFYESIAERGPDDDGTGVDVYCRRDFLNKFGEGVCAGCMQPLKKGAPPPAGKPAGYALLRCLPS